MNISGGSTTQAGIYYQNTIAALYMGRMLDPRISDLTQKVATLRSEARTYVDDIVVEFADGHRDFIQVKENIAPSGGNKKWRKLWSDFEQQRWDLGFTGQDRLVLFLGKLDEWFTSLDSLCERARGARNPDEWQEILSSPGLAKVEAGIRKLLAPEHQEAEDTWRLLAAVAVEQKPLDFLESIVADWMPPNSAGEQSLFSALREICGQNARFKIELDEERLRRRLKNSYAIEIFPAPAAMTRQRLKGSVLFEDGRPVEQASVRVIGLDVEPIVTGPGGYFEFEVEPQPSWMVQAAFKEMSMFATIEQDKSGQAVLIRFPRLASFSIDAPREDEEIPLGENKGRVLEGSFPILDSQSQAGGTARVSVEVVQYPEGTAVEQDGRDDISGLQGRWYFRTAKFSGEGQFDIIATARVGDDEDFRKVRVRCVGKDKYYQQAIDDYRKYRGRRAVSFSLAREIDLDREKEALFPKQAEFFKYYTAQQYERALVVADQTLEILDQALPAYPEDLWLQNLRAYTFKNMAMALRELGRRDDFYRSLAEAEKMFKAIRDQDPEDAGAWNGLGSVAALRGEFKEALAYIEKALEIQPDYPEALRDREMVLGYLSRWHT